jgi:hypothetical protein
MGQPAGGDVTGPAGPPEPEDLPHGPGQLFWPGVALGGVIMAFGLWGLLSAAPRTRPSEALRFVVGAAVVHDLVLAPVVIAIGLVLARVVPARARGPVQGALVVSGAVALFAVPFVRGYGRVSTNPSILPRDYGEGLFVVLAAVWTVIIAMVVRRGVVARRTHRTGSAKAQRGHRATAATCPPESSAEAAPEGDR